MMIYMSSFQILLFSSSSSGEKDHRPRYHLQSGDDNGHDPDVRPSGNGSAGEGTSPENHKVDDPPISTRHIGGGTAGEQRWVGDESGIRCGHHRTWGLPNSGRRRLAYQNGQRARTKLGMVVILESRNCETHLSHLYPALPTHEEDIDPFHRSTGFEHGRRKGQDKP